MKIKAPLLHENDENNGILIEKHHGCTSMQVLVKELRQLKGPPASGSIFAV